MTWRDDLRPASYRDVPFHVENADQSGGRRQVVHEFPQRDDAFVEDLGLRPHEFRVEGFVLGAAYMAERDALIAALEGAGPGTLVHPYRGALTVSCVDWMVRETSDKGGAAFFSIVFVASAVQPRPAAAENTGAAALTEAAAASAEAETGLVGGLLVAGFPGFVAEDAAARLGGLTTRLEAGLGRLGGAAATVSSVSLRLQALRTDALGFVFRVPDLAAALSGLITSARLLADTPRAALRELKGLIGLNTGDRAPGSTPARAADQANAAALERAVTLLASAEAVAATTQIDFDSYDDAVAIRDDLAGLIDDAALRLADAGDDAGFDRLNALRLAMVRDVTRRGGSLARVYGYTPAATEPALVIANRLYADAGRAADIVARNRVRHPGFVPGGAQLEVLTDV